MPPKKPTLTRPSRPDSGTLQIQATGNSVALKVPSPPPDKPVGGVTARAHGALSTGSSTRRAGSRARRVPGLAGVDAEQPTTIAAASASLSRPRDMTALRPGVAAALSTRQTTALWAAAPSDEASQGVSGGESGPVGSAVRVGRLLRDARAAVRGPARPVTPADYLQPGPVARRASAGVTGTGAIKSTTPRPPPGRRLAALKPLDGTAMAASTAPTGSAGTHHTTSAALSPSSAAVAVAVRNSQLVPDEFLVQLIQAEGNTAVQVALLRELNRWLSNPTNRVWPALVTYFRDFLDTAVEYPSADRHGDTTVAVMMGGVVLRSTADVLQCEALPPLTRLLRTQVQGAGHTRAAGSLSDLLEQEALFEPLFYVLRQCCGGTASSSSPALSDAAVVSLLECHTSVALDVLEVLRGCTTTYGPELTPTATEAEDGVAQATTTRRRSSQWTSSAEAHRDGSRSPGLPHTTASEDAEAARRQQTDQADRVCELLATSGLVPTLNTLLRSLIRLHTERAEEEDIVSGMLLPSVCLLLRNLAGNERQSGHLRRLGTLELLLQVLDVYTEDVYIVEAASRALAKLVFVPDCLLFYQQDTRLVETAVRVLLRHTESISEDALLGGSGSGTLSAHTKMLVARLCSTVARVVEGSAAQLSALARGCEEELLPRLVDYAVTRETVHVLLARQDAASTGALTVDEEGGGGGSSRLSETSGYGPSRRRSLSGRRQRGLADTDLLDGVVWLVGLVAVNPTCTTAFVRRTVPALTDLLKVLDLAPSSRLTGIYTLMALSNLSYYFASIEREDAETGVASDEDAEATGPSPFLSEVYESLGLCLAGLLFEGDAEATVEATRVLSNMSYTNTGREWMENNKCDEVIVIFLGHEDLRVVYNCFGILLNLTAATRCRVVEEAELLRMLLQSTGRYTRREDIDLAAAEEKRHLLETALGAGDGDEADATGARPRRRRPLLTEREAARLAELEAQELATGYAAQIAELVEKVLQNVHGLLVGPAPEELEPE